MATNLFNVISPGVLEWFFIDINLPDTAADIQRSVGFVKFSIQPLQTVTPGTVIENNAAIIFDNNLPVITNTVFNTILGEPLTISPNGPATFCSGDSVILTASSANSYLWSTGDTSQSITVTAAGNYSVTDASGCLAPSDTVSVTVHPEPVVDAGGCETVYFGYAPEECTDLSANVTGGTQPYTYLWNTGDTTKDITVCPSATTVFSVAVTDANGCEATDDATVEVVDVRCGQNNNKLLVCHFPPGNLGNAQTLCIDTNAVANHLANHGDILGGCDSIDPCLLAKVAPVIPIKSADEIPFEKKYKERKKEVVLNAYPNPFNDKTIIEFTVPETQHVALQILSISGESVSTLYQEKAEKGNVYNVEFDALNLAGGIYFCKLITASGLYFNKLVVIKR